MVQCDAPVLTAWQNEVSQLECAAQPERKQEAEQVRVCSCCEVLQSSRGEEHPGTQLPPPRLK